MITIDWKERLTNDTTDYLANKLPRQNYDFDIIFNWYPERVNVHIPNEVIQLVVKVMAQKIGKLHEQYIPFYQYLWDKKGENGKMAFIYFLSKFFPKKPAIYLPMLEKAMQKAGTHEITAIFEKVFLPLFKKSTEPYLSQVYPWLDSNHEPLRKQAAAYLVRMMKLKPEIIPSVLHHQQNKWVLSSTYVVANNVAILKAIHKINPEAFMNVYREYKSTRDPQTVEILCGAILDYHPELLPIVENWTHSGNARLKKAATAAYKILLKKKA
jgi:hypothetical protein